MTFPPAGGILEHKGGFLMREFFHNMKLSFLLAAVLYIILGLILLIWPGVSATVFCYAFGGILLIYGVVTIVSFFLRDSRQGSFVFELFLGIVAAALGLLFLLRPVIVASVLPVILGLFIVVDGLVNLKRALELRVSCVIVCQAEVSKELLELDTDTCIISTPYDAYRAVHLVCHALPIERICKSHDLVSFHLDDYIDDVRDTVLESRFRAYPILDENEHVVGTLSRYHLLRPRRKQVILMDHNEKAQSVPGLEQANILEIVDHHRLADIETGNPIYVRNEPVGSTATIVADMYQEKGLMPTAKMAGLIAAAIVSDTVMFKSPTCTQRDIDIANRMSRIANVPLDELGRTVFSAACGEDKRAESILTADYKEFHIAGHNLAVSQVTCMDSDLLMNRKDEFLDAMLQKKTAGELDAVLLMITDVLREGSYLLYIGDEESIRQAFGITGEEKHAFFIPKLMSRKKQIIPALSALWG